MHFGHCVGRAVPTSVQPCLSGSTSVRTAIIRYAPRAVGVNPSASQGEARLRGRERNNDSKTVFLTRWNRSCPCTAWERGHPAPPGIAGVSSALGARASRPAWERGHPARLGARASCPTWERGRLARVLGARASCPTWERERLARMPGTRASRPAWERGRLARMPGSAGILPRLGSRASRPHWERGHLALDAPRGRDVLALQGQVFWEAPAFLLSFWSSGRPKFPFSHKGRRGSGG